LMLPQETGWSSRRTATGALPKKELPQGPLQRTQCAYCYDQPKGLWDPKWGMWTVCHFCHDSDGATPNG